MQPPDDVGQQVVVFREWIPEKGKAQQVIEEFKPLLDYTNERHADFNCLFLLREIPSPHSATPDDGNGVLMTLASFENKIAYQQYLLSPAMLTVKGNLETASLLQPHAKDILVRAAAGFPFRATHHFEPECFVVTATMRYVPETRGKGIAGFRNAAEYAKEKEDGVYSLWFLEDLEDLDVLYCFQRYESGGFLWDVHSKSEVVAENVEVQKGITMDLNLRFWRQVGGSCNSKRL